MNESRGNNVSEAIFLSRLYERDWSMAVALTASILNIMVVTPLAYSVIWFEKFGSDLRRTLLNQIVATICWNIVFQNTVNVPLEIALTIYGPFGSVFCSLHMISKYSSMLHLVSLLLVMIVTKYLAVFHLKNPTSIDSKFWTLTINTSLIVFSVISQSVFTVLPGKNPVNIYICMGKNPSHLEHASMKTNYPFASAIIACFILYVFAFVRIKIYKKNMSTQVIPFTGHQGPTSQESLANFGSIGLLFVSYLCVYLSYHNVNSKSPELLDSRRYLLLIHFFHHVLYLIWNFSIVLIFILKSNELRSKIGQGLKDIIKSATPNMIALNDN